MTDNEFMNLAEALLLSVEQHCDRINESTDADIDNQRVGGMVTLVFANRSQIVINLQKPLHEVWLATAVAVTTIATTVKPGWTPRAKAIFGCNWGKMPVHKPACR